MKGPVHSDPAINHDPRLHFTTARYLPRPYGYSSSYSL